MSHKEELLAALSAYANANVLAKQARAEGSTHAATLIKEAEKAWKIYKDLAEPIINPPVVSIEATIPAATEPAPKPKKPRKKKVVDIK